MGLFITRTCFRDAIDINALIHRYTYGKSVSGTVLLKADIDYPSSPWKHHGDEAMVEINFDVSQGPDVRKHFSVLNSAEHEVLCS